MLGKTHLAVGIAVSMTVLRPDTLPELVTGLGAASVGALISDIDIGAAGAHRDADIITAMSVFAVALVVILDQVFHVGIWQMLMQKSSFARIIPGALAFIGICAFGKEQPHRSFMHSFLALFLLSALVNVIFPTAMPYFALAFLSHLAADLFNYKRVRLLYPMKKGGFCLKLFRAKGFANRVLFLTGSTVSLVVVAVLLVRILAATPLPGGMTFFRG